MDYVTDLGDQLSPNTLSAQENNSDTTCTTTKNIHNSPATVCFGIQLKILFFLIPSTPAIQDHIVIVPWVALI